MISSKIYVKSRCVEWFQIVIGGVYGDPSGVIESLLLKIDVVASRKRLGMNISRVLGESMS